MSEPKSDKKPDEIQNKRTGDIGKYLGVVVSGFLVALLNSGNSEREKTAEQNQQRADAHLIATATDKMAKYTKLLSIAAVLSFASAAGTAYILWNQLTETKIGQRPYISLATDRADLPQFRINPAGSRQVLWNWYHTNFGKGVAYRVNVDVLMKIDGAPFERSFGQPKTVLEAEFPPGITLFGTAVSKPGVDNAAFNKLLVTDRGFQLLIKFRYFSEIGDEYTGSACMAHLASNVTLFRDPADCKTSAHPSSD